MSECMNNCQCCCNSSCPNYAEPGMKGKHIRVYGTLLNHTLDVNKSNGNTTDEDYHNDALAYAYQLYDNRFGATPATANYQDVINKRLTAITYADGITTVGGDLYVDGDIYYKDDNGNYVPVDLADILRRLANLEAHMLWELGSDGKVHTISDRAAAAHGFYDTEF